MGSFDGDNDVTGVVIPILVALGGGLGALVRWALSLWVKPIPLACGTAAAKEQNPVEVPRVPLPTFLANISACALLGLVARLVDSHTGVSTFLAVGFCGGLSTYSTFAVEVAALLRSQHCRVALIYLLSTLLGGLLVFLVTAGRLL